MKFDDKERSLVGLAVSLRDMGDGTSRLFIDDVRSKTAKNPKSWNYESFYTFSPEFENAKLDQMQIEEQDIARFGEAILARLLALKDG